jgi:hypothetical protein
MDGVNNFYQMGTHIKETFIKELLMEKVVTLGNKEMFMKDSF